MSAIFATSSSSIHTAAKSNLSFLNPVRLMAAHRQLTKLRSLDSDAMRDMGLSQDDINQSKFSDFL